MGYKDSALGREYRKGAADSLNELRGLFTDNFNNWKKVYSTFVKPVLGISKESPQTINYHTNTLIERFNLTPQYLVNVGALREGMVKESDLISTLSAEDLTESQKITHANYAAHSHHNGNRKNRPVSEHYEADQEGIPQDNASGYNRIVEDPRELDEDHTEEVTHHDLRRRVEEAPIGSFDKEEHIGSNKQ